LAETTALANLPEYLLDYRLHETQAGRQHSEDQKAYACRVQQRLLENLGLKPTAEELALHEEIAEEKVQAGQAYFARALDWLRVLQKQNDRLGLYPRDTFALLLAQRWKALYIKAGEIGLWPGWNFIFSSRAKMAGISLAQRRKYCLKQWKKTVACAS
jgi:hypothetical protein